MIKDFGQDSYTDEDWKLYFALEKLSERGRKNASLGINGDSTSSDFEVFKRADNGCLRNLVIFHQQGNEGCNNLGRSCSMSVDNVSEVSRFFEIFFELGTN
jgi:hypothetical protein